MDLKYCLKLVSFKENFIRLMKTTKTPNREQY